MKLKEKLLGKKVEPKTSEDGCDICAKECSKPKQYKILVTLTDATWNEDIKRYVFIDPSRNGQNILIIESKNVEFITDRIWTFTDGMYEGRFDSLTITLVK